MIKLYNNKNDIVLLNCDKCVYLSQNLIEKHLNQNKLYSDILQTNQQICFTITEPSKETGIPSISEPKLGKIV